MSVGVQIDLCSCHHCHTVPESISKAVNSLDIVFVFFCVHGSCFIADRGQSNSQMRIELCCSCKEREIEMKNRIATKKGLFRFFQEIISLEIGRKFAF